MTNDIKPGDRVQQKERDALEKAWVEQYLKQRLPLHHPIDATVPQDESPEAEYQRLLSETSEVILGASRTPQYEVSLRRMKLICAKATIQDALDSLPPANEILVAETESMGGKSE